MPALHFHKHEYVEVQADQEARMESERLANQYGEIFSFLHEKIIQLERHTASQSQFEADMVQWMEQFRGFVEAQCRDIGNVQDRLHELESAVQSVKNDLTILIEHTEGRFRQVEADLQSSLEAARGD